MLFRSLCVLAPAVEAHRLDELLQATYVAVDPDRTRVELYLSVGAEIAGRVEGLMDADGDGVLTGSEQERFAVAQMNQLSVAVDGTPMPLTLSRYQFPDRNDLAQGTGVIRLTFAAAGAARGRHRLTVANHAEPVASVYQEIGRAHV